MTDESVLLRDPGFMRAVLDVVLPASGAGRLPSAADLDLGGGLADTLEADAKFGPAVEAGLQAVHDAGMAIDSGGFAGLQPDVRLEVFEGQLGLNPALVIGLTLYLYPAYYQHPRVLEALGEPPRPPFPEGFEVEEIDEGLLEKLRSRQRSSR